MYGILKLVYFNAITHEKYGDSVKWFMKKQSQRKRLWWTLKIADINSNKLSEGLGRCPKNLQGTSPLTHYRALPEPILAGRQEKKKLSGDSQANWSAGQGWTLYLWSIVEGSDGIAGWKLIDEAGWKMAVGNIRWKQGRFRLTACPFSGYNKQTWADHVLKYVIKLPCSRGDSGALYLQSATAGVMFQPRVLICRAARCK